MRKVWLKGLTQAMSGIPPALPEGDYYIYAKIDDGVNSAVYAYGGGKITLSHAAPPSLSLRVKINDTGITWGDSPRVIIVIALV